MADWLDRLDPNGGPLYLQIADAIHRAVDSGVLRPGERLPPQRELARRLDVDLTTVTRAYTEARHRRLLDAVTGRGSFVAARREPAGPVIDLGMNLPPPPRGLRLADLIESGVAEVLARSSADLLMSYQIGAGSPADRAAAATWLAPVLGRVPPERLLVAAGAQAALAALLSTLARPGETVLADRLTYPGFRNAARQFGLKVVGVEGDAEGMRPDALEEAVAAHAPRLLYLMPAMHNPTAVTMPPARRRDIARIATAAGIPIVEDDPYSLLAATPPAALASLAGDRTYYVATVSKCLTPGLRIAYVAAPDAEAGGRLAAALRALTLMAAPLMTALLTHWIREGKAAGLLAGVREEARERQRLAREILPAGAVADPQGLHVWQPLPHHWDRHALVETARRQGLGVTPSDAFCVAGLPPDAVRISLGGVGERARLAEGLRTLAAIIRDERSLQHAVV